jgi:hypothetical protein
MTAHEGMGIGLGGGSGEGVALGRALGDSLGVGVATGVGLVLTAVPGLPQAASTRRETSTPTPTFMRE